MRLNRPLAGLVLLVKEFFSRYLIIRGKAAKNKRELKKRGKLFRENKKATSRTYPTPSRNRTKLPINSIGNSKSTVKSLHSQPQTVYQKSRQTGCAHFFLSFGVVVSLAQETEGVCFCIPNAKGSAGIVIARFPNRTGIYYIA